MLRFQTKGECLHISGITELSVSQAQLVKDQIRAAFVPELRDIEMDLSQAAYVDSSGLGVLISLRKHTQERQGRLRVLRPPPSVQQLLDHTRMGRIFEIVRQ